MPTNKFLGIVLHLLHYHPQVPSIADINSLHKTYILSSVNNTVLPCEDFYAFACGNYAEQHRTNHYQEITSLMDYQYNKYVLNLIDSLYQHDHQIPDQCQTFVEKTRVYLNACRKETQRNLTRYFEEIKPSPQLNWPILEEVASKSSRPYQWYDASLFNGWALLGQLQSYGLNNVLINQEITVDKRGEFTITLEPAYTENNSTLPDENILQVLLKGLGVYQPESIINKLKETNELLVNILEQYGTEDEESLQITYSDLETRYPNLNFTSYVSALFNNHSLPADTLILLRNPDYFQHLNDELFQVSKSQDLCNYLMMQLLYYLAVDSTSDFKPLDCVKDLRNKMDLAVNFLYYLNYYAFKERLYNPDVVQIFRNIKYSLSRYFRNSHLNLNHSQVKTLLDKLRNVRINIGNLPNKATCKTVKDFYGNVPYLDENNYYRNHLLLLKHRFDKSLYYAQNQTHYIVPDNGLGSSSGPIYVTKQNMIILPYGSLQKPIYDINYHDFYKYSLLGFILAHELAHAFDTVGLNYNSMGEVLSKNSDILDNENFQNSLECLQSQLSTESIDERLADIVGIHTVYDSYVSMYKNVQRASERSYWNELFFMNLAQFFCGKSNLRFIDHDSDAQRLNQIVMNSAGFSNAFQCPFNSKMNPRDKCCVY